MVGGVSGRELGTGTSADDGFFAGVVDFDAPLAWNDIGEVATATPPAVDGAMIASGRRKRGGAGGSERDE